MNVTTDIVIFLILALNVPFANACDMPSKVSIPIGVIATESEMITADATIKTYFTNMQQYIDCLETDYERQRAAPLTSDLVTTEARERQAIDRHNAAVEEMQRVAEAFNRAIAEFESRQ